MTEEEFEQNLKALESTISQEAPLIVRQMAMEGKALVNLRIVREGLPDATYSKKKWPTYYLKGKERNARGTKYIEENPMGNWGEFRKAQGLRGDKVDLTYTTRMWTAITVTEQTQQGNTFTARLGATDKEEEQKLEWNQARYGNFLLPNEREQALVDQVARERLETIIKIMM